MNNKKRTPLANGTIITLQGVKLKIDSMLASGAKTIAYKAQRYDPQGNPHPCILKELYLSALDITRDEGLCLVVPEASADYFESEKQKYRDLYNKICTINFRDAENNLNSVCAADSIMEGYGTVFIECPFESASTFCCNSQESIAEILRDVGDVLCITKALHDNGILHLDIKPQNILRIERRLGTRTNARLHKFLDFDSAVWEDEALREGAAERSFTEGFGSPEQSSGVARVSKTSDIYAIGALLFYIINGRTVGYKDTCFFANYEFDRTKEMFLGANRLLFGELERFFRQTITFDIGKRFQSCSEAIAAVEEMISLAENKPGANQQRAYDVTDPRCVPLVDEKGAPFCEVLYPEITVRDVLAQRDLTDFIYEQGLVSILAERESNGTVNISKAIDKGSKLNRKNLVLTGPADSGKSALLKKLYCNLHNPKNGYLSAPIYLDGAELNTAPISQLLLRYFGFNCDASQAKEREHIIMEAFCEPVKKSGPAFTLIVDDYNEVSLETRQQRSRELLSLAECPNLRVLISSRTAVRDFEALFTQVEVLPLSSKQINEYLKEKDGRLPLVEERQPLYSTLNQNISLLKLYADNAVERPKLNDVQILAHALSGFIGDIEDSARLHQCDCDRDKIKTVLYDIALKLCLSESRRVDFGEIVDVCRPNFSDGQTADSIAKAIVDSGIFISAGSLLKISGTVLRDYIVSERLREELQDICAGKLELADEKAAVAGCGYSDSVLLFLAKSAGEDKNITERDGERQITDRYRNILKKINDKEPVDYSGDSGALLTLALFEISKEKKHLSLKAIAVFNILRAMELSRDKDFSHSEQKQLWFSEMSLDLSAAKKDEYISRYYTHFAPLIGEAARRRKALINVGMALLAAAVAVMCLYVVPHMVLKEPALVISESNIPETIREWDTFEFTIADTNKTGTLMDSRNTLVDHLRLNGIMGSVQQEGIVDADTVKYTLYVDAVISERVSIVLPKGVLYSRGSFGVKEYNGETVLLGTGGKPTNAPIIALSVNGKRYHPSYSEIINVTRTDDIYVKLISPNGYDGGGDSYLKYMIGTGGVQMIEFEEVGEAEMSAHIPVPRDLNKFSLQLLARMHGELSSATKWSLYNFAVIETELPYAEIDVEGVPVDSYSSFEIKRNQKIHIFIKGTEDDAKRVEYFWNRENQEPSSDLISSNEMLLDLPADARVGETVELNIKIYGGGDISLINTFSFKIVE